MKVICAWCKNEMSTEDGPDNMRYSVCRECLAKFKIFPDKSEGHPLPASKTETE